MKQQINQSILHWGI